MPLVAIYNTQHTVTSLFLSPMGYPWHLPHSIVYVAEAVGRLGLHHLGHEQGVQQTLQLLQHLHANTTNGKLYAVTINQYQIYAGTQCPILEDNKPIPWILDGWISSIRKFLHTNNCKILLQKPWTSLSKCIQDWCIMNDAHHLCPNAHLK